MGATDGLKREMKVIDTEAPLSVPVGRATLKQIIEPFFTFVWSGESCSHKDFPNPPSRIQLKILQVIISVLH